MSCDNPSCRVPLTEKVEKPKTEKAAPKVEEKVTPKVEEVQETVEEEEEVTLEMLRAKFGSLIKKGKKAEVQSILESFEVSKLTDLPKSEYANALAQANAL
jgi:hypothetical protein